MCKKFESFCIFPVIKTQNIDTLTNTVHSTQTWFGAIHVIVVPRTNHTDVRACPKAAETFVRSHPNYCTSRPYVLWNYKVVASVTVTSVGSQSHSCTCGVYQLHYRCWRTPGVPAHMPHPQGSNFSKNSNLKKEDRTRGNVDENGEVVDVEQFFKDLRQLQRRTHCTEQTVLEFVQTFEKYTNSVVPSSMRVCDKKMQVHKKFKFCFIACYCYVCVLIFYCYVLLCLCRQKPGWHLWFWMDAQNATNSYICLRTSAKTVLTSRRTGRSVASHVTTNSANLLRFDTTYWLLIIAFCWIFYY